MLLHPAGSVPRGTEAEADPVQADAEGDAGRAGGPEGRGGRGDGLEGAELVRVDGQGEDVFYREGGGDGAGGGFREGVA